ncbi:phosphatase 2C-like domain-containing protein [Russula vinacea]|nr:phosphatase 2C-like domain-containing protein [Russula vinacea]
MFRRAWKPSRRNSHNCPAGLLLPLLLAQQKPHRHLQHQRERKGTGRQDPQIKRSFPLLSKLAADQRITESAVPSALGSTSQTSSDGLVWKHTTARLSSNDPVEDMYAHATISTEATSSDPARSLLFYSVMDGHSGFHTSRLLSHVLIPAVVLELSSSAAGASPKTHPSMDVSQEGHVQRVSQAIRKAFDDVDFEIVNGPLRVLAASVTKLDTNVPDLSKHPMGEASMSPALSGSCALMALLDPARRDLFVACAGDSRAVAGIWEENGDGTGKWRVEVLTEDQTGRNPKEAERMRSEHPESEAEDVIKRGRVLGGLEVTRALGDACYKWPLEVQELLHKAFIESTGRTMCPARAGLKTPPYVIATPVVTHQKISLPNPASSESKPSSSLKFLVLATDGLWDVLSSEDVVALVGGYFAGLKGTISKSSLPALVPTTVGTPTVQGKEGKRGNAQEGSWAFVDDNVNEDELRKILSIPAPHSRRWRDDVTVTVVWWEEEAQENGTKAKL